MKVRPLSLAIVAMSAIGVIAATAVIFQAMQPGSPSPYKRFATGEMRSLTTLRNPPPQPVTVFKDADGVDRTLADWRGRVVLVNLWATWCAPCVKELPTVERLAELRASERFAVAPISLDRTIEEAGEFYAEHGLDDLPLLHDRTFAVAKEVGAPGLPVCVLYDAQGVEIARLSGGAAWDAPEALALIDAVIAESFPEIPPVG